MFIKLKSSYYIGKVKCLIEVYTNFTSEFDRGHGPLRKHQQVCIQLLRAKAATAFSAS